MTASDRITIQLNGEERVLDDAPTIASLIEQLGLHDRRVAAMLNGDVVPRVTYADRRLADGDTLELVTLVGGG